MGNTSSNSLPPSPSDTLLHTHSVRHKLHPIQLVFINLAVIPRDSNIKTSEFCPKKLRHFSENLQRFFENLQRFSKKLRRFCFILPHSSDLPQIYLLQ